MTTENSVKHNWRDGVFRYLFKEEANFVQMYEVFTGEKLCPNEIEFRDTNSILMSKDLKNDVAFLTKSGKFIALVEHQHTENPNMAIRMMIYYAELLKMHIHANKLNIFGKRAIEIPIAEFYVAYTGNKPWIASNKVTIGDILITIKFVNITHNELNVKCRKNVLAGYSYLLKQFEYHLKLMSNNRRMAIDKALEDCRKNGYLTDYLDREEFSTMIVEHWSIEQQMEDEKRWAREDGVEEARVEIAKSLLTTNMTIEEIANHSKLSAEQVKDLIK